MNDYADLVNEYVAHHYAYMTHVVEVHEPESYAKATKDANWRVAMEEEMHVAVWFFTHNIKNKENNYFTLS